MESMRRWVLKLSGEKSNRDFITAFVTILGSIGAAVAISRRERTLYIENEKLKGQLLLWRLLTVGASIVAAVELLL